MTGITSRAGARTEYRIYPSIGIARVGNSTDGFFIGPEAPGIAPEGPFRGADGIKPQGARFRIYRLDIDSNENETVIAEIVPKTSIKIKWTVQLANRKAAAAKILDTLSRVPQPPGLRNQGFDRKKLVISAEGSIEGAGSVGSPLTGSIEFATGASKGTVVKDINLATLRTDANGRLVVVGGPGTSESPFNSTVDSFADNDGWYDSVSDGPVTATLIIDGQAQPVIPAWVVVTVPRYAPEVYGIVTWYDRAVAMARTSDDGTVNPPRTTSFTRDIYPVLKRADGLHWVHQGTHGGSQRPLSDAARIQQLQDSQPARAGLLAKLTPLDREAKNFELRPMMPNGSFQMPLLFSGANPDPKGSTYAYLSLTWYQMAHFQNWVAGNFDADWPGPEPPPKPFDQIPLGDQPHALSEAALEACIGGPFFPGIEATYDIARLGTYRAEAHLRRDLRINLDHPAGFLTEKMALPWQADYADCADFWWPSQRPVRVTKQDGTPNQQWDRGINGINMNGHLNMVKLWFNLAFVLRDPASGKFAEVGRQPINGKS